MYRQVGVVKMSQKKILIIGATGGIGKCLSKYLDEMGYEMILAGTKMEQLLELRSKLTNVLNCFIIDLTKESSVDELFQNIRAKKIKLDGVVYAAGIEGVLPVKVIRRDFMRRVMDINCFGFVEVCKQMASKRNSNDGASIVAISSMASIEKYVGEISYDMSKAALDTAVKTASKELIGRKIRVNSVLPATTETLMIEKVRERIPDFDEKIKDIQTFGIIEPENIATLIEFLLSDKSLYITGDCIPVGAGRSV